MNKPIDKKPENPEAFAAAAYEGIGGEAIYQAGMSLRDYFAAHCPITFTELLKGWKRYDLGEITTKEALERYAKMMFDYADAMMEVRKL